MESTPQFYSVLPGIVEPWPKVSRMLSLFHPKFSFFEFLDVVSDALHVDVGSESLMNFCEGGRITTGCFLVDCFHFSDQFVSCWTRFVVISCRSVKITKCIPPAVASLTRATDSADPSCGPRTRRGTPFTGGNSQ